MKKHFVLIGFVALFVLSLTSSCCHKKEEEAVINAVTNRVWFTSFYERWDTDYHNDSIPDSYRSWTYYKIPGSENWLWYFFEDYTGYEIHTEDYDTIYYHFEYSYKYKDNSLYVKYETIDGSTEDYHAVIKQLDDNLFIWTNEYRSHSFEKVTTENVTGHQRGGEFKVHPKKVSYKPVGPMIPITK